MNEPQNHYADWKKASCNRLHVTVTLIWNVDKFIDGKQNSGSLTLWMGFHNSSVGKESVCDVGDPSSIPRSGRSPGEGIGYPLQYSWASLVAQMVKNSLAMWETWVQSLDWEDSLEKGKATHSSILAWEFRRQRKLAVHRVSESRTRLSDFHFTF